MNTRPVNQQDNIADAIFAANGQSVAFPTLEITATPNIWLESLPSLDSVFAAIFVSPNAVHYTFYELNRLSLTWPDSIKTYAIGQGTARALNNHQLESITPARADSEHLVALSSLQSIASQTIVLFKGKGGRTVINQVLSARHARLIELDVYQRSPPKCFDLELLTHWFKQSLTKIILFTSEQGIINLCNDSTKPVYNQLKEIPCIVISYRLAKTARQYGYTHIIVSTIDSILETLYQFKQGTFHDGR